mgnify:CR=1 FL=1
MSQRSPVRGGVAAPMLVGLVASLFLPSPVAAKKRLDQQTADSGLKEIQAALQKYGDTHPDIAPILQKYRITDPKPAAPPAAPKK